MVPLSQLGIVSGDRLNDWPAHLPDWPRDTTLGRFSEAFHGDYPRWANAVRDLPPIDALSVDYGPTITLNGTTDCIRLEETLKHLHPWRKGPFSIAGVHIETEWRSDWKWDRVASALHNFTGKRVLDIGCGNGYFGWRMLAAGAREVIGIDPTLLFCMQHLAIQKYIQDFRNWVLPLRIEEIPATEQFDAVFSMGVIYHRRDPVAHCRDLFNLTAAGGLAVLESLVVEDKKNLIPTGRYARMRNVWCVPIPAQLEEWMCDAGFTDVKVIDVSRTTIDEQHSTDWMTFESLPEALDPENPDLTVEGHPAPVRAIVTGIR